MKVQWQVNPADFTIRTDGVVRLDPQSARTVCSLPELLRKQQCLPGHP